MSQLPVNASGPALDQPGQPILTHEKSLANKIARGSEAGDILDQQLAMLGIQLVTQLNVLVKTARIHGRTNTALDKPVNAMIELVKTLAAEQPIVLRLQNDFLFLGNSHLKMNAQQMAVFTSIIECFNKWALGGISFTNNVESQDIREWAYLFTSLDPAVHALEGLVKAMRQAAIKGIELEEPRFLQLNQSADLAPPIGQETPEEAAKRRKARAKVRYVKAASAVGDFNTTVRRGGKINFKQAKRAIQNVVDLMMQDEASMLGLTSLRCHDQYTYNHSVNVSLLSVALGNRAGYPKVELADLGLAALFHDMGKSSIPPDVLNKPSDFTEDEWTAMRSHPIQGVLDMTKLRGIARLPGRMAAASFEHHMNCDFTGYPALSVPWKISVTGRILMIADCYDAMTSSRVYRREPIPPAKVLTMMFAKAGTAFDPVLLKLFVNCVGIVPIGTLVLLDSNQLAVVLRPGRDKASIDRPLVKVITDPDGQPIEDGPELDLTHQDDFGAYTHSIVQLVDNTAYRFDTSRYFV